jgi:hypothetical protein
MGYPLMTLYPMWVGIAALAFYGAHLGLLK